ncbi:fatty acid desaturase [Sphingomonas sp. BIUV-7]|uniref:Fatty acid desaturase n=1 Tax=Sphingomonas natans TaxID=3063330 RepID=A0ABT8YG51_9SPHN|nr:fatty acid desaturase [Sphingomonas sp. BIUV-7]MDO6416805.1 fatty acid desaturase [Sphingomonas sp. BIUV-7]
MTATPDVRTNAESVSSVPQIDTSGLLRALTPFRAASNGRGILELVITVGPLVALWITALFLVKAQIWAGLLLTLPAGAFLLRLFMIQHDCGHGSFFRGRQANGWVGRVIGVLTFTPYEFWRRSHAHHHAGTGNLDRRGTGDIDTLTLAEFRQRSRWQQLRYRMYRNPIVLFVLGPAFQFLLVHRFPVGIARGSRALWMSVMGTNIAIALLCLGLIAGFGLTTFFLVHLPITLVAASLGIWLFYIQHQFEQTSWDTAEDWSFQKAALHGSSHYDLPPVLRWFSANIGVHHVHHLCSTIPFYRMQRALAAAPQLREVGRMTLRQSFRTIRLALWDEKSRRMISFRDAATA